MRQKNGLLTENKQQHVIPGGERRARHRALGAGHRPGRAQARP